MGLDRARRAALDQMLNDRRLELGLRWRDVAKLAGVSAESIRAARHGDAGSRDLTLAGIERALKLAPGCLRAYFSGRADVLQADPSGTPLPGERTALWVDSVMTRLGVPGHRIEAFAERMGWTAASAPAPADLTIAQLHAIAEEAGLPLQTALDAIGSHLAPDAESASAGARRAMG